MIKSTKALFFFFAAISIALTSTTSEALPVVPQLGGFASPPIVLAANGCGPGRYRGPYGSCHRFGRGLYPGGYMDVMRIVSAGMGATAPYIARAPDFALLTSGISVPVDEARQFGECAASGGMIMPHPNHPDPR
jgi:hypothetical protein